MVGEAVRIPVAVQRVARAIVKVLGEGLGKTEKSRKTSWRTSMRTGGAPRRLCWFALLLLLALSSTVNAQPIENSASPLTSWKAKYYLLAGKVLKLERAWNEERLTMQKARELVTSLQTSLSLSQMETEKSISLSETLQIRLDAISAQILEVEAVALAAIRSAWIRGAAIGAGAIAAVWIVIELLRAIF